MKMNPYSYNHHLAARNDYVGKSANLAPGPVPQNTNVINSHTLSPAALKAHGASTRYVPLSGNLAGLPRETVKYTPLGKQELDAEPISHTHHRSSMDPAVAQQISDFREASFAAAISSPGYPISSNVYSTEPVSFATGAPETHNLLSSRVQSYAHDFYNSNSHFASHAWGAEPNLSTAAVRPKNTNQQLELRDTNTLPSSQPISLALLATKTVSKNKASKAGKISKSGLDEGLQSANMNYNHAQNTQADHHGRGASNALPPNYPLRNVALMEAEKHHYHINEINALYQPSPQHAHNFGKPMYSMDPSAPMYNSGHHGNHNNSGQLPPHQQPQKTKYVKPAVAPSPRPEMTPGPRVFGPDELSPAKQEDKFAVQKMMLEKMGDAAYGDDNKISQVEYTMPQTSNPLRVRVPPGFENTPRPAEFGNGDMAIMGGNIDEQYNFKMSQSQTYSPSRLMQTSSEFQSPNHSVARQQPQGMVGKSRMALSASASTYDYMRAKFDEVAKSHYVENGFDTTRQKNKDAVKSAALSDPFYAPKNRKVDDGRTPPQGFDSPAWDVGNLRRAGFISSNTSPVSVQQKDARTSKSSKPKQDFAMSNNTGPAFGRYIGGHVSLGPDIVYRPVPWPVDQATEDSKHKSALDAKLSASGSPSAPEGSNKNGGTKSKSPPANSKEARMAETLSWYHTDRRWKDDIEKQIDIMADKDMESLARAKDAPTSGANQVISDLLQKVIANFRSYVVEDRDEQAGSFSNFGPIEDKYCEPYKGGIRSYFDVQPGPFKGLMLEEDTEDKEEENQDNLAGFA